MDELERDISDLPWREPSPSLRQKIFDTESEPAPLPLENNGGKAVSLWWAVASAAAAGIIGFGLGTIRPPVSEPTVSVSQVTPVRTEIRVVETFSSLNSFDFTAGSMQVLPGEFVGSIDGESGTNQ